MDRKRQKTDRQWTEHGQKTDGKWIEHGQIMDGKRSENGQKGHSCVDFAGTWATVQTLINHFSNQSH